MEWMKRQLSGKNSEALIGKFGEFLQETKPGDEPSLDEIQEVLKK